MDFQGGLYAVANFADGVDGAGGVFEVAAILSNWVEKSGCFEADASRYHLNHFISTTAAAGVMGYFQQDLYMPIRIKEILL